MSRFVSLLLATLLALSVVSCREKTEPPKALYPIGAFSLTNQDGKAVTQADFEGKVWVAAFMFTRCPTVCPRLTARMKALSEQADARGVPLSLVSFSVDPENDTPAVLKAYAAKHGIDGAVWTFLTGDYEAIKKTSVEGFKVALEGKADEKAEHYGILHGSHLILVDAKGQIRGYYASSDDAAMDKLLDDAAALAR